MGDLATECKRFEHGPDFLDQLHEWRVEDGQEGAPRHEPEWSPRERATIAKIKENALIKHWKEWPDMPLPALGGRSPREAARTPAGRVELEALFRDMEAGAPDNDDRFETQQAEIIKNLRAELLG